MLRVSWLRWSKPLGKCVSPGSMVMSRKGLAMLRERYMHKISSRFHFVSSKFCSNYETYIWSLMITMHQISLKLTNPASPWSWSIHSFTLHNILDNFEAFLGEQLKIEIFSEMRAGGEANTAQIAIAPSPPHLIEHSLKIFVFFKRLS